MADPADSADKAIEDKLAEGLLENERKVAAIPKGVPGECEWCGLHFPRTVNGACGKCRDAYRLD